MGLITVPKTLNDGTDDRIFDFQYQEPGSVVIGRYNEPAGSASARSLIRIMHTTAKSGRERHLSQKTEICDLVDPAGSDPTADAIVCNITVEHHPKHSVDDIIKQVKMNLALVGTADFVASFVRGNV